MSCSRKGRSESDVRGERIFCQQWQNTDRRANLESVRKWTHVGVSNQKMQPTVLTIVGQRLIACVDDRSVELYPLVNVVDDVICSLADLKWNVSRPIGNLKVKFEWIRVADPPRAGKDLARRQKTKYR